MTSLLQGNSKLQDRMTGCQTRGSGRQEGDPGSGGSLGCLGHVLGVYIDCPEGWLWYYVGPYVIFPRQAGVQESRGRALRGPSGSGVRILGSGAIPSILGFYP